MPQSYSVAEKDQGVSTSGWRDEGEVSECNAFAMSLEFWLKMAITDFPECQRNNIVENWKSNIFELKKKGLNPGTQK